MALTALVTGSNGMSFHSGKSSFQLGECLWLRLQFVITFHHAPSPQVIVKVVGSDFWNLVADDVAFCVLIFVLMINATINNATVKL